MLSQLAPGQFLQRDPDLGFFNGVLELEEVGNPVEDILFVSLESSIQKTDGTDVGKIVLSEGNCPKNIGIEISGIPVGGPYLLQIVYRGRTLAIRELFCGDIWIMAGQSNMEGMGLLSDAASSLEPIRHFTMARVWKKAEEPLHWLAESPDPVHNEGRRQAPEEVIAEKKKALKGAGLGLHFAKRVYEYTSVPQALVSCAHGGTSMTQWDPDLKEKGGESCYGSMILSMKAVGQKAAGMLWYQGCSDATDEDAVLYTERMKKLVAATRKDLRQPDLPWLTVQIGSEIGRDWGLDAWHNIQEQQRRLPEIIGNLDLTSAADLEHDDWIHISGRAQAVLADRLFILAKRMVYGEKGLPSPQPERAVWAPDVNGFALRIRVNNVEGKLSSAGLPQGFALVDREGREKRVIYQTRFEGSTIRLGLTSDELAGLSLMHGQGAEARINTTDGRGLPLPVFGPLPIEGLPAHSPWFRSWWISNPLKKEGAEITPALFSLSDSRKQYFEGWNVISLKEVWKDGPESRLFATTVHIPADTSVCVESYADGPFKAWIEEEKVLDQENCYNLETKQESRIIAMKKGVYKIYTTMENRGGAAYGFCLRFRRTDSDTESPLLPREEANK